MCGISAQVQERQDGDGGLVGKDQNLCRVVARCGGAGFQGVGAVRCGRFPDLADEAKALAGDRSDQALLLAAVADRFARRIDVTGQG